MRWLRAHPRGRQMFWFTAVCTFVITSNATGWRGHPDLTEVIILTVLLWVTGMAFTSAQYRAAHWQAVARRSAAQLCGHAEEGPDRAVE